MYNIRGYKHKIKLIHSFTYVQVTRRPNVWFGSQGLGLTEIAAGYGSTSALTIGFYDIQMSSRISVISCCVIPGASSIPCLMFNSS